MDLKDVDPKMMHIIKKWFVTGLRCGIVLKDDIKRQVISETDQWEKNSYEDYEINDLHKQLAETKANLKSCVEHRYKAEARLKELGEDLQGEEI